MVSLEVGTRVNQVTQESFHDTDGQDYLFYQGNNDLGKTWYLSFVKIGWKDGRPFVIENSK
jgi:hypothetical protein